ncbi:MAG TPA: SGNH/GDSL hydrolase family protein [Anaeromyxobacteraceae bacterium]|nr:SGNH/GDSL hydrolase family protein [Anaeromyxobacteraceae bacterium]
MPTILCYGDSNTWGADPATGGRHPAHVRWPGVLKAALPASCQVVEEGLRGRTTLFEDPFEGGRNGLAYLGPCLLSHAPLDLVVVMLGTNDVKEFVPHDAPGIAAGAARLVRAIRTSGTGPGDGAPAVLLVAPAPVALTRPLTEVWGFTARSVERSHALAAFYRAAAEDLGCDFMDAGALVAVSSVDGVHLDPKAHERLGRALAERVRRLLRLE